MPVSGAIIHNFRNALAVPRLWAVDTALVVVTLVVFVPVAGRAQAIDAPAPVIPIEKKESGDARPLSSFFYGRNGLQLYSATTSAAIYSLDVPGITSTAASANQVVSGAAAMGWNQIGQRSTVAITYVPTYTSYPQRSDLNAASHSLSMVANRRARLSSSWSMDAGVTASGVTGRFSSIEQLLLAPTMFRTAVSVPATIEGLSASLFANPFASGQFAAMLTGSAVIDASSRQLLFGSTAVSGIASLGFSYAKSPRTSVTIGTSLTRAQPLSVGESAQSSPLLTHSTSGNVGMQVSHALSPRTQVGVSTGATRTVSSMQDVYQTSATAFIGHNMGRQWFAQLYGGGGSLRSMRSIYELPSGLQYQAGGGLGVRTYAHTLVFSTGRSFGDRYGIGAGSTVSATATWNWAHPRRTWTVFATVSEQWFQGGGLGDLPVFQASAGYSKALTPTLSVSTDYVYISTGTSNLARPSSQRAARASLVWTPRPAHPR